MDALSDAGASASCRSASERDDDEDADETQFDKTPTSGKQQLLAMSDCDDDDKQHLLELSDCDDDDAKFDAVRMIDAPLERTVQQLPHRWHFDGMLSMMEDHRERNAARKQLRRQLRSQQDALSTLRSGSSSMATIVNRRCLRRGEVVQADPEQHIRTRQKRWVHPNAWTLSGCLRLAFESIGC